MPVDMFPNGLASAYGHYGKQHRDSGGRVSGLGTSECIMGFHAGDNPAISRVLKRVVAQCQTPNKPDRHVIIDVSKGTLRVEKIKIHSSYNV